MDRARAATEFLNGFRSRSGAGDPMERLGRVLEESGDGGLSLVEAMERSQLSREEFYSALSVATKLNLIESFDAGGANRVRMTKSGRSLY